MKILIVIVTTMLLIGCIKDNPPPNFKQQPAIKFLINGKQFACMGGSSVCGQAEAEQGYLRIWFQGETQEEIDIYIYNPAVGKFTFYPTPDSLSGAYAYVTDWVGSSTIGEGVTDNCDPTNNPGFEIGEIEILTLDYDNRKLTAKFNFDACTDTGILRVRNGMVVDMLIVF